MCATSRVWSDGTASESVVKVGRLGLGLRARVRARVSTRVRRVELARGSGVRGQG
jgi:hypothetical protein